MERRMGDICNKLTSLINKTNIKDDEKKEIKKELSNIYDEYVELLDYFMSQNRYLIEIKQQLKVEMDENIDNLLMNQYNVKELQLKYKKYKELKL